LRISVISGVWLNLLFWDRRILYDIEFDSSPLTGAQGIHANRHFTLEDSRSALADTCLEIVLPKKTS
jgi:hypothetical protein